ncbi:MAG: zinc ribbon domain-containing protein, partial [Gemmatimonadaceae bacterium]
MPTYEYLCPNGHHFERIAKMSESVAELVCPECGAVAPRQISGGAGLVFKGTGFYLTDYGRNAHRAGGGETMAAAERKRSESSGEAKSGDAKGAEAKPSESKASEAKPAESKVSDSKASDSKPASSSASSTTRKI